MTTLLGKLFNRAPAYTPQRGGSFLHAFRQKSSSEQALEAMGSVGTLFAILDKTTTAVAEVEWKLYRKSKSGKKADRREVTTHAALDLWNKPNPFMPRQEFVEVVQQHQDLTGEQWWIVSRNAASPIPLELWPVRPDRMEPVPDADNYLKGYVYTTPDGDQIPLELDEVIFIRKPNPLSPYRGLGPVQSILVDLDSSSAAATWNRNFFQNSARPGGLIQYQESLSDQEFDELRDRWDEQHRGVSNSHRVAILENGAKWVDVSYSMRDMQFTEIREINREMIREAFGFPKPMLGTVDDTNRANMEAAEVTFARHTVRPRLERIKQALNYDLLPMFGSTARNLEFDYEDPVEADQKQDAEVLQMRATAAATLIGVGFRAESVAEALELPAMDYQKPSSATAPVVPSDETPVNVVNATAYVVKAKMDDNTCEPCAANDGHKYDTKQAAYADYPGGEGYTKCIGAKYGNDCRCVVRRSASE